MTRQLNISTPPPFLVSEWRLGSARFGSESSRVQSLSSPRKWKHTLPVCSGGVTPPSDANTYLPSHHGWRHLIFIPCVNFWKSLQSNCFDFFMYLILFIYPVFFLHWLRFSTGPLVLWHFRLMLTFCNTRSVSQLISTWLTVCCTQHWLTSKLDVQLWA